jgi:phosphohistidine swiveling domain-containing protein
MCYAIPRMADESGKAWTELLRGLEQVGQRRRDGIKRIGHKAFVLANMARQQLPVPASWVLDARHYQAFVDKALPRKHDVKSLIKLTGTRAGDERCARAYDELLAKPIDEAIVEAIEALWEDKLADMPLGVAVRPSMAASGSRAGAAVRHLHSRVGLHSAADVVSAVREVWASSVLSQAVAAYAEADVKDVAVAVLLQEAVPTDAVGMLTRTTGVSERIASSDWQLGVMLDAPEEQSLGWQRRAQLLLPLAAGVGGEEPPAALARLRRLLGDRGFEQLAELGEVAERELGRSAVVHFAVDRSPVERGEDTCRLHVLGVDDSPRWLPLRGGDESTCWVELTLGGRSPEPPTRLTQSVLDRMVHAAVEATLTTVRSEVEEADAVVSSWGGRSYLNSNALRRATVDVPLLTAEDLLHAVGGMQLDRLPSVAAAQLDGPSLWRLPLVGTSVVMEQVKLDSEVAQLERGIERDARGLADMDLTLLPNDALGTTLTAAQALLERSAELWCKCTAALMSYQLGMRTVLRRRIPDVDPNVGYELTTGSGALYVTSMATAYERLAQAFREDGDLAAQVCDRETPLTVARAVDLPDGRARGALGHFLSSYGNMALGAFELSTPRWKEDAGDLMRMLAITLRASEASMSVDALRRRAHAVADRELARYEPELRGYERRLLRAMMDRHRSVARSRVTVDRLLFRVLQLMRRVVLDIDRRLRRIDPSVPPGGAFHCSAARLAGALKSGRPELARVIRMRIVEREEGRREPAPPPSFLASPPRGGIPISLAPTLEALGVSAGVTEGRARVVRGVLPDAMEPGEVLVLRTLDPALAPLCAMAGAVVAEVGGAQSLGAQLARELGLPCVMSAHDAVLSIVDGERLRVDGSRGTVQRLDMDRARGETGASVRAPAIDAERVRP